MTTKRPFPLELLLLFAGVAIFGVGSYLGLVVAPPERYMGEVGRILYIHVPTAWIGLIAFTVAFGFAVAHLVSRAAWLDDVLVGLVEVGVVLAAMLIVQGSIWAKPTWGVFWTWDPRLTTAAIMLMSFAGVLALRAFVKDPQRRARWTAVGTVIAFIDVPLVYFSIKWWRTLHQDFSGPNDVVSSMQTPTYLNALALALIAMWLVIRRSQLARRRREALESEVPSGSTLVAGD